MKAALSLVVALFAYFAWADDLPSASTPGAVNPAVNQDNLAMTVCASGWTKTVRPPTGFTGKLARDQIRALGLPGAPKDYEEDHRVPLECGGAPKDSANLWPEHWSAPRGAHQKDRLENFEHRRLCRGEITLAQCQTIFLGDFWVEFDSVFGAR